MSVALGYPSVPLFFDRVLFDERESDGWPKSDEITLRVENAALFSNTRQAIQTYLRSALSFVHSSWEVPPLPMRSLIPSSSESLESANDLVVRDRRVGRALVLGEVRVLDVFRRFDAMVISLTESKNKTK